MVAFGRRLHLVAIALLLAFSAEPTRAAPRFEIGDSGWAVDPPAGFKKDDGPYHRLTGCWRRDRMSGAGPTRRWHYESICVNDTGPYGIRASTITQPTFRLGHPAGPLWRGWHHGVPAFAYYTESKGVAGHAAPACDDLLQSYSKQHVFELNRAFQKQGVIVLWLSYHYQQTASPYPHQLPGGRSFRRCLPDAPGSPEPARWPGLAAWRDMQDSLRRNSRRPSATKSRSQPDESASPSITGTGAVPLLR